ncbi:TetR/AcrR family transcriptional regulator [Hyphomonas sp.]|uniref:TetR/AcrR family transcriptional regulator n=1 Tax=Hyphomonas sp. TaxID=87 RepID=UPI0025C4FDCA|nr:TetR/AcrR family transcriptional regulator [Hyphomonas sp.]
MTDIQISKVAAKRESRLSEILDCAELHFVEKGFHGAGISGIAKECGISVGHLYHYFSSKDMLVEAVVERELTRQQERLADFQALDDTEIRDQLIPMVLETITKHQDPFRTVLNFEILAEAQRNPSVASILHRFDQNIRTEFCKVLERAGIPSPMLRTEMLFTFFSGIPARSLRHPEQERAQFLDLMKPIISSMLSDEDCGVDME